MQELDKNLCASCVLTPSCYMYIEKEIIKRNNEITTSNRLLGKISRAKYRFENIE